MKRLAASMALLVIIVISGCGSQQHTPSRSYHAKSSDLSESEIKKQMADDLRFDLICTLEAVAMAEISVDKLILREKFGLYKLMKKRKVGKPGWKILTKSYGQLDQGSWETPQDYLKYVYTKCMQDNNEYDMVLSDAHAQDVHKIEACMEGLERNAFIVISTQADVAFERAVSLYGFFRSRTKGPLGAEQIRSFKTVGDEMYENKDFESVRYLMKKELFECKSRNQRLFYGLNVPKLLRFMDELGDDDKSS